AGPGALPSWLRSRYITDVKAALPAPHGAVLLGIVLGIRQGIPAELQNALIATGLIHLLVLSGLKVAVFARIVQGALNPLLGRYAAWPAVELIALYALVACGLVLGALSFTVDLARMAAVPVAGLLAYIEQVGYVLARVPAAAITIPTFPTWLGAAYYSALGPAVAAAHSSGDRRKAGLVVAGLAPAAIALTSLALWANAPPQAVVMNVGDGQAILLRGPQGTILIDGGPSPAKLRDELGSQLPPWQSTL